MTKINFNHNYIKYTTKKIKPNDELLILDMTKIGFTKNPVLVMTSFIEMGDSMKLFREIKKDKQQSKYIFNRILKNIMKSYNNLDNIYDENKKEWDDFCSNCVLYCAGMKVLYDRNIPMYEYTNENIKIERVAVI